MHVATQKLNHKWTKRMRDKTNGKVSRKEMKKYINKKKKSTIIHSKML